MTDEELEAIARADRRRHQLEAFETATRPAGKGMSSDDFLKQTGWKHD